MVNVRGNRGRKTKWMEDIPFVLQQGGSQEEHVSQSYRSAEWGGKGGLGCGSSKSKTLLVTEV
jgi:hypothetical protein